MEEIPLVSICCLTYNHEKYIRQCLDGFLNQKTNFEFEVLIHDDASTDKTQDIIREYQIKYNEIIKPIFQKENQYSKGIGISNVYQFPRAKGKYIAMCEGDDFWTDNNKLQKQVDLLESNKNLAGSAHGCCILFEASGKKRDSLYTRTENIDFNDYLKHNFFITTGSLLFHNKILKQLPPFMNEIFAADFVIKFAILCEGKIGYIPEVMSVYRKGSAGSWSKRNITVQVNNKEYLDHIRVLFYFDKITDYIYHGVIQYKIKNYLANYFFKSIAFNTFGLNTQNLIYSFIFLPIRVKVAFIRNLICTVFKS